MKKIRYLVIGKYFIQPNNFEHIIKQSPLHPLLSWRICTPNKTIGHIFTNSIILLLIFLIMYIIKNHKNLILNDLDIETIK